MRRIESWGELQSFGVLLEGLGEGGRTTIRKLLPWRLGQRNQSRGDAASSLHWPYSFSLLLCSLSPNSRGV